MTDRTTHLSHDTIAALAEKLDKAELAKRLEYALKGLQFIHANALNFDNPRDARWLKDLAQAAINDAMADPA